MFLCLMFVIFIISFSGISLFIYDKLRINPAFIPITTVAAIVCFTYISGLVNILRLSVCLLFIFGIIYFVIYLLKIFKKKLDISTFWCPGIIFFSCLSLYFFILLNGASLIQYDNFSHWGLIVKEMFYFNSLPDSRTIITFRNYPPGTACFIYFVCKILGYTEGHALIAQSLIISSALTTLFCKVKFKNWTHIVSLTIISITSICAISYDDSTLNIYNLLVDTVLAFVAVSSLVVTYYYRGNIKKLFWTNLFILSSFCLIKDSAKIFLFIICLFTFIETTNYLRNITKEKILKNLILFVIPMFLSLTLWKAYNQKAYLFFDFYSNKFTLQGINKEIFKKYILNNYMSIIKYSLVIMVFAALVIILNLVLRNYKKIRNTLNISFVIGGGVIAIPLIIKLISIFSDKSKNDLNIILFKMQASMFDLNLMNNKLLVLANLISTISIIILFILKKDNKLIIKSFLFTNILTIFYILNLYVLYAVIMDEEEGLEIAAFDRYLSTVVIILFLIQLLAIVHTLYINDFNKYFIPTSVSCLLVVLSLISVSENTSKFFIRPNIENFPRYPMKKVCEENKQYLSRNQKIAIYLDNGASKGYNYYLSTYELLTKTCNIIDKSDVNNAGIVDNIADCEYLLITKHDEIFWVSLKGYGVLVDDINASLYRISKLNNKLCLNKIDV